MQFQVDMAQLKSGGPYMTIETFTDGGNVLCAWFDGNEKKTGVFNPKGLIKAE